MSSGRRTQTQAAKGPAVSEQTHFVGPQAPSCSVGVSRPGGICGKHPGLGYQNRVCKAFFESQVASGVTSTKDYSRKDNSCWKKLLNYMWFFLKAFIKKKSISLKPLSKLFAWRLTNWLSSRRIFLKLSCVIKSSFENLTLYMCLKFLFCLLVQIDRGVEEGQKSSWKGLIQRGKPVGN